MADISGASLNPIYQRLNSAPQYHPLEADTFADWSMEAGDIVKVSRDGNSYESPVHNSTITWKKGQKVTVSSDGNEKRDTIAKVSRTKYGRGGGGVRVAKNQYVFEANQQHLLYEVDSPDGKISRLEVTMNGLYHDVYDSTGKFSRLSNTVDGLYHEVYEPGGAISVLENSAKGFRTRISKVVDESGTIKAAEISTSINEAGSEAYIEADHIKLKGNVSLNGVMSVEQGSNIIFSGNILARAGAGSSGYVSANAFALNPGGYFQFGGFSDMKVTGSDFYKMIKTASVSNNILTLTRWDGTKINFSKATSLSGTWSGGHLTVTASPQNEKYNVYLKTKTATRTGTMISVPIWADIGTSGQYEVNTGWAAVVNVANHFSSMSITRSKSGRTAQGADVYYGKMYYWDEDVEEYVLAATGNHYWYYSSTNRTGTNTVYY